MCGLLCVPFPLSIIQFVTPYIATTGVDLGVKKVYLETDGRTLLVRVNFFDLSGNLKNDTNLASAFRLSTLPTTNLPTEVFYLRTNPKKIKGGSTFLATRSEFYKDAQGVSK